MKINDKIVLREVVPEPEDYNFLRKAVGWNEYQIPFIQEGLKATLFCICAFDHEKVIGMGRVIGDGKLVFYIQDVIVMPDYQRAQVGTRIMDRLMRYIEKSSVNNSIIGLMSAVGKETFYEKYGFERRPSAQYGCGMTIFVKKYK